MRIRNFSPTLRPRRAFALDLATRRATRLIPDSTGQPIAIELDLAVALETGEAALVIASPNLLTLGLTPAAGALLITEESPVVLRLWINPPFAPIELPAGIIVANVAFLEANSIMLFDDPTLDDLLDPEPASPFSQFPKRNEPTLHDDDLSLEEIPPFQP